ncbi:MAG: hypothetical protein ACM3X0_03755 [Bacteroidota bacterium]
MNINKICRIFAVSIAAPCLASAAEVAKIEVYADGVRQHSFFSRPQLKLQSFEHSGPKYHT